MSEQCKFLLRRQNHVGNGPSVSGLEHPKKHRSGRRVWREAGAIRREHAHRQEMPTSAQLFDYDLSISKQRVNIRVRGFHLVFSKTSGTR